MRRRESAGLSAHNLLALVAAAVLVSACQGPVAASNGLVWVANLSQTDGSLHWQSPGLFGTSAFGGSGTEPIRACQAYGRGFAPGDHQITISSTDETLAFTLPAPPGGQMVARYVIRASGHIERVSEGQGLTSPYCAP